MENINEVDNILENDSTDDKKNIPLWEQYEDFEDNERGRGGGGGGKKPKTRDPQSLTSKAARSQHVEHSQENKREVAKNNIKGVIGNFPQLDSADKEDKYIRDYVSWVKENMKASEVTINEERDLAFTYMRSGAKAGGQNVNKVNSAVRCVHLKTNIVVRNDETRDQPKNKSNAVSLVKEALDSHIEDWKVLVKDIDDITEEKILNLILE